MSVLEQPLVFVDIETNGLSSVRGRVIEIAAIRVEGMEIVGTMTSLVNPGVPLPAFITELTGITTDDVIDAPYFGEISQQFQKLMDGAIFVAHNVRFDYSFIKQEFKRLGLPFDPKLLCTVRLSRALYPEHRKHSLKELIVRHNLSFKQRHRAYDDAHAIYQFYKLANEAFTPEVLTDALKKQLKLQALPSNIDHDLINNLPNGPGVYVFEDENHAPLYIGKSIGIRKRVLSHFTDDYKVAKELKMSQHVRSIRAVETAGELEALLLESQMIKDLQPLYNIKLRKLRRLTLLMADYNTEGYAQVRIAETDEISTDNLDSLLAVQANRSKAKHTLESANKLFNLCPKLLGLEKGSGRCFYNQLGKCYGACVGAESPEAYNQRLLLAFKTLRVQAWPYKGAILIEEQSAASEKSTGVVVDQWCIVAQINQEPESEVVVKPIAKSFDLDTYKILSAFLTEKRAQLNIRSLSPAQLQSLFAIA